MSEKLSSITDATFEDDVIKSDIPVLVDFWAEWCGPCRMVTPVLEMLADEYDGQIKIVKLNIDENQEVPARYGVRSIPTLIIFKNGENVATKIGAASRSQLAEFVEGAL